MRRQRHGRIICTGSPTASWGRPPVHGYASAKARLAAEFGGYSITVNPIAGRSLATTPPAAMRDDSAKVTQIDARVALRRQGTPRDMVGIPVLLTSEAGGYVTGQEVFAGDGMRNLIRDAMPGGVQEKISAISEGTENQKRNEEARNAPPLGTILAFLRIGVLGAKCFCLLLDTIRAFPTILLQKTAPP